jgi:hypothetical protein
MTEFSKSEMHHLTKALAITVEMLEKQPRDIQSFAGLDEMKAILDRLIESDIEREMYSRQARVAITGSAD